MTRMNPQERRRVRNDGASLIGRVLCGRAMTVLAATCAIAACSSAGVDKGTSATTTTVEHNTVAPSERASASCSLLPEGVHLPWAGPQVPQFRTTLRNSYLEVCTATDAGQWAISTTMPNLPAKIRATLETDFTDLERTGSSFTIGDIRAVETRKGQIHVVYLTTSAVTKASVTYIGNEQTGPSRDDLAAVARILIEFRNSKA